LRTNENEELLHTSSNIYDPIQNYYTFWSLFLDDTFGFTFSFHVNDTFCNSTLHYRLE
jgi:hypothetical protein